jgi:type IV pilus assembly protein PilC
MLFSTSFPLNALAQFCRMVRHGLAAGLSVVDVFKQQSVRGPISLRPTLDRITAHLERGESLEDALSVEGEKLPVLLKSMASVGEHTGHMPEVFHELERYYELQYRLRRQFIADITWPVTQFVMAVGVIAMLLWVLGMIGSSLDPLGFGLTGASGAITFLVLVGSALLLGWAGFHFLTRMYRNRAAVERFLLKVPALGPCLESIALGRFALALRLTLGAGLPPKHALRRSLEATGNSAYSADIDSALEQLRRGEDLTAVLRACRIFPEEFLDIVSNAEEGGRIPEVMEKQAEYYQEEASRRLTTLTKVAGFLVWLFVAILMVWAIFRIYFQAYLGQIDALTR